MVLVSKLGASVRPATCALFLTMAVAHSAGAVTILNGSHDENAGDGYWVDGADLQVVVPRATFSNNGFNGLSDYSASLVLLGGTFEGNVNVGVQAILAPGQTVLALGGNYTGNLAGLDVRGATLNVFGGHYNANSAYGLSIVGPAIVYGGQFLSNGLDGVIAFGGLSSVYGGTYGHNGVADFAAGGSGTVLTIYGTFDHYGAFNGDGSFTGSLADGGAVQTFVYSAFDSGTIVLAAATSVAATVPEPSALSLTAAGGALMLWSIRRRAFSGSTPGTA